MYASAWVCTKQPVVVATESRPKRRSPRMLKSSLSTLEEIDIGSPMVDEETAISS